MNLSRLCWLWVAVSIAWTGSAVADDSVTMQLGWIAGGERAFYYLAKDSGLFSAEHLDVRILPGKGATDSITKVATGVADFGEAGLDAVLAAKIQGEVPVKVVMPLFTVAPDGLMTTTQSGIRSLKDLEGRSVATSPFTSSNGPWPFLLRLNGIDPEKVRLVKADPAALVPMLAAGQVDAIIQFVNNGPLVRTVLRESNKEIVVLPWSQYGLEGYSNSISVSDKTLATRRDLVVRFTRALRKAIVVTRDDPALAVAALKKAIPQTDADTAEAVARATLPLMFNANTTRDGLGVFSPALVKTTWEWAAKTQGAALDKLDPMQAVDLTITTE
jgi:NitT/TauT family transport system substrate-binding protein